jgi:hypothetical protein
MMMKASLEFERLRNWQEIEQWISGRRGSLTPEA